MLERAQHIHFIGIGGIGMSGLAKIMLGRGKKVSGSDLHGGEVCQELRRLGATVHVGHRRENIDGCDLVVYTSAAKTDNPELLRAKELGIAIVRRARLLGELTYEKQTIAVTGAHGKTTTSAMTAAILETDGKQPSYVLGGIAKRGATNARDGKGSMIVVEADESDGSFVDLNPMHVVITNVDTEHLDFYPNIEAIQTAMRTFAAMTPDDGVIFANADDARLVEALKPLTGRTIRWFGVLSGTQNVPAHLHAWAQLTDAGRPCRFTLHARRIGDDKTIDALGEVTLMIGGRHNASNALAAASVAHYIGCRPASICAALDDYQGVQRRSEHKGDAAGIAVYDDYAHHPTEVEALLTTMRSEARRRGGRLISVFQPHRYSRFYHLHDDFLRAYRLADRVLVLPVYGAHEAQNSCASPARFAALLRENFGVDADYTEDLQAATDKLAAEAKAADLVITTGAGDVYKVGEWLIKRLEGHNAGGAA